MPSGSPLVVRTTDLRRRLGTRRPVERTVRMERLEVADAAVEEGTPVRLDLVLEAIPAGVAVTGRITTSWHGACRRCLRDIGGTLEVHVAEVFAADAEEGDTYPLAEDHLDLEPLVREALLLDLPAGSLCEEACAGPAPERYTVAVGEEPAGDERRVDPRWAALDVLRDPPAD